MGLKTNTNTQKAFENIISSNSDLSRLFATLPGEPAELVFSDKRSSLKGDFLGGQLNPTIIFILTKVGEI